MKKPEFSLRLFIVPQTGLEPVRLLGHRIFVLTTALAAHVNVICSLDYLFTMF